MQSRFLEYNLRICAGVGPWILVVPVASAMLVLFALMAMTSLIREHTPLLVLELTGPLAMAFVGTSLLRPEYEYNALEVVLTRPVSFRAIVGVRMLAAGLGVMLLLGLMASFMHTVMDKEFHLGQALLAAAVSTAFLTSVAVAVAALSRSPTLGFVAAAALWALDVLFVGQLNPLLSLLGYAMSKAQFPDIFASWQLGKAALVVASVVLLYVAAQAGARPAGQWNLRRVSRAGAWALAIAVVYLGTGAVYKVRWGIANEAALLNRSRAWYQAAFKCYRGLPVAPLMGASFARFVGYRWPWQRLPKDPTDVLSAQRYYEQQQLRVVAFGSSTGQWVDNALYGLGRGLISDAGDNPAAEGYRLGVECLDELVRNHPESPFAPFALERLANIYQALGDDASTLSMAEQLTTKYPDTEAAFRLSRDLGMKLRDRGQLTAALAFLEPVSQRAGKENRPTALVLLGDLLSDRRVGHVDRAVEAYREADRLCNSLLAELMPIEEKTSQQIAQLREIGVLREQIRKQLSALGRG